MNENDKELISAFYDNELTGEEKSKAERLIAEDKDAYAFLQSLKIIENEVENFFEKSLNSPQARETFSFIENLKGKVTENSSGIFQGFFSKDGFGSSIAAFNNRAGLAFSFALLFSAGFFSNQFLLDSKSDSNLTLESFTYSDMVELEVMKTRSSSLESSVEDNLIDLLDDMTSKKSKTGRIIYGQDIIEVSLIKKFYDSEQTLCFEGELNDQEDELNNKFVFCKNPTSNSFIYK